MEKVPLARESCAIQFIAKGKTRLQLSFYARDASFQTVPGREKRRWNRNSRSDDRKGRPERNQCAPLKHSTPVALRLR
jgi:hypothetical protein